MYSDTITLFNRKPGGTGDVWYPTVLHNVHLNMDKSAILAKYGAEAKDSASLHVRYSETKMAAKIIGKKEWLPPKQWQAMQDPSESITFSSGTMFDFFWLGEWDDKNPIKDTDYAPYTDFYTYMNSTHDFVFAISSVGGPYSVIPHFEIMGK